MVGRKSQTAAVPAVSSAQGPTVSRHIKVSRGSAVYRAAMLPRRIILPALTLLMALGTALPAHAAESGLDISIRSADPARPVLTLTNSGAEPCQVVGGSSRGTVAFVKVEQAGKAIAAQPIEVSFSDGLDLTLRQRLQTLEPGRSLDLPLAVVPGRPGGLALEMITWSESAGYSGAVYPLADGAPLSLEVFYNAPIAGDGKTPVCGPATSRGTLAGGENVGQTPWTSWAIIAGAALLLLVILAVVFIMMHRGRRRRRTAVAAVLLVLAPLAAVSWEAPPAGATIKNIADGLQDDYDNCMAIFAQPGHDPANLLDRLQKPDARVTVEETDVVGDDHTTQWADGSIHIYWDPDHPHTYFGGGGIEDPCSTLYHELYHASRLADGTLSRDDCATGDRQGRTLERRHVDATHAQNMLRRLLGLPERTHYGQIPLPDDCKPPGTDVECDVANCADSNGDPHLRTYDGKRYDFQAVGEFILSRQTSGTYQVQVRQEPVIGSRLVAVNTAVAMQVGPDRVEIRQPGTGLELLVGGEIKKWGNTGLAAGGVRIGARGTAVISWKNGPRAFVRPIGRWGLHVTLEPTPEQLGRLEGLLGDFDGDSANDIKPRGSGTPIKEPTFEALYPAFADSWRIDAQSSLFTYDPGTATQNYTDRTFPEEEVKTDDLPSRGWAEAVCRTHGVTDASLLAGCITDVALTGQADFAAALGAGQILTGGPDFGGTPFTLRIEQPGREAFAEFDGTAGQQVFIDVPAATFPSTCGSLALHGPDGKQLRSGCITNHRGIIDAITLPVAGRYKVTIKSPTPGVAQLRVITIGDVTATLTPDAAPTTVALDKPGMVGRFTFAGRKDQKVYLDVLDSTLHSQCGVLELQAPDKTSLRSGCIVNGRGELDGATLPLDGTYTITIDPAERNVGTAVIKLINAVDQAGHITLDGPPVTASIQQPGAVSRLTFAGVAGQRIYFDVVSSNLPSQCGVLDLRGPADEVTITGCIVNGAGGLAEQNGYVLKATGVYTLVIDPNGNTTGEAVLKLHS